MDKVIKHKLVNLFLQLYTRRRDFSHSVTAFKQLTTLDFQNIVIYSTTALGDFLMNTPAIHEVRRRFPAARITLVCGNKMAAYVRTGIGKDWDEVVCWNNKVNTVLKLVRNLKAKGKPDLVLIMHSHNPYDYLSAVMAGASFIFRYNQPGSPLIERWLTNCNGKGHCHSIQRRLNLIMPLQCQFTERSIEMRVPCPVTKEPSPWHNVGFQMGASSEERCWPVSHFVQVATALMSADEKIRIVLFGSLNEIRLSDQFLAQLPAKLHHRVLSLTGKTSIAELTQAVNNIDVLVTGDTGTMHIAIALKIRTVSLFVSAAAHATGPYQDPHLHRVISGFTSPLSTPPGSHEMTAISADRVINATRDALADVYQATPSSSHSDNSLMIHKN